MARIEMESIKHPFENLASAGHSSGEHAATPAAGCEKCLTELRDSQ